MSKRSRPKRKETVVSRAKSPAIPASPSPGKPQHYRLVAELTRGTIREAVTLVEGGPLAMCEDQGMRAANYGVFHLAEGGIREWYRPTRVMIEPMEKNSERSKGDGSHSEADS